MHVDPRRLLPSETPAALRDARRGGDGGRPLSWGFCRPGEARQGQQQMLGPGPPGAEPQLAAKKEITREGVLLIKTDSVAKARLFFFSNYFAAFLLMLTFNLL